MREGTSNGAQCLGPGLGVVKVRSESQRALDCRPHDLLVASNRERYLRGGLVTIQVLDSLPD